MTQFLNKHAKPLFSKVHHCRPSRLLQSHLHERWDDGRRCRCRYNSQCSSSLTGWFAFISEKRIEDDRNNDQHYQNKNETHNDLVGHHPNQVRANELYGERKQTANLLRSLQLIINILHIPLHSSKINRTGCILSSQLGDKHKYIMSPFIWTL